MNETVFILWIIIWVIFLTMSTIEKRGVPVFGFLSGLWILFLGVYIYLDGIEILNGMTIVGDAGNQTVIYSYQTVVPPFNEYSMLWGFPFILLGIYICFLSATKNRVKKKKG